MILFGQRGQPRERKSQVKARGKKIVARRRLRTSSPCSRCMGLRFIVRRKKKEMKKRERERYDSDLELAHRYDKLSISTHRILIPA